MRAPSAWHTASLGRLARRSGTLNLPGIWTLASLLRERGDCERAEPLYRRAAALYAKLYPRADPSAARTQSNLAACLTTLGRYAEAEPLLLESYGVLRGAQGAQDPRVRETRERLIALYTAWGRPEDARRWRRNEHRAP